MDDDSEEVKWWFEEKWVDERVESKFGDGYSYKFKCPVCGARPFVNSTPDSWEIKLRCHNCDTPQTIRDRRLDRKDL